MSGIVGKNAGRASGIVGVGDIGVDAVDSANIADDAIDSEHYTDGSIDNAHIADNAIDSEHYADGSIDTAHIADNQITLALMAGGTDGNIISYDASGDPVAIATGDDGQVLTSAGAGAPPVFEDAGGGGGGAWTLIGSTVASDDATIDITGLSSTYDCYAIVLADVVPAADGNVPSIRFGDSGGVDSGAGDYSLHRSFLQYASGSYAAAVSTSTASITLAGAIGSAAGEGFGCVVFLSRPGDGTMRPSISGSYIGHDSSTLGAGGTIVGSRNAVITLDRIQILFGADNVGTGRISVYGIAHA